MRALRWGAVLGFLPLLHAAAPQPADWVPMRWPWSDPASLELLSGTPINCLLLKTVVPDFVQAAAARGVVTLAVIAPGGDVAGAVRRAMAAKVTGIVIEGDLPEGAAASERGCRRRAGDRVDRAQPDGARFQRCHPRHLPGRVARHRGGRRRRQEGRPLRLGLDRHQYRFHPRGPRVGRRHAVDRQPAAAQDRGHGRALPASRSPTPPSPAPAGCWRWTTISPRAWPAASPRRMADWKRMADLLRYFEQHPEWRHMQEYGKLAIVQDPAKGGLLSGGILDMIAVKHTPVRPVPRQHLSAESLAGATMAVDVDADALTPEQKEVLSNFTRGGGMLLTGPPGWKDQSPPGDQITLDKAELERLNDIWRDVNSMVGRRNMGVRLFNVSSMLSNLLASADGKTAVVHLVNYSDYPVENVAVHFPAEYKRATLTTPEGVAKSLEVYPTEEGGGVDIDKVLVCATIKLEQ